MIEIPNTVVAYNVWIDGTPIGHVFLRDEYWHARANDAEKLTRGGEGFIRGRGYTSRDHAGTALARETITYATGERKK